MGGRDGRDVRADLGVLAVDGRATRAANAVSFVGPVGPVVQCGGRACGIGHPALSAAAAMAPGGGGNRRGGGRRGGRDAVELAGGGCPWHPAVNTEFAEGYSEKAFCSIRKGMSEAEVLALLGEPFRKSETMMAESGSAEFMPVDCWHYSRKRQDKVGEFASLVRIVAFRDGTVVELFTLHGEWL